MSFKDSKVYILKDFNLGKFTRLRSITFVCREKQFYHHNNIGIWWSLSHGGIVISKGKNLEFRFFMIGIKFINIICWLEFKYLVKSKNKQKNILLKD